MSERETDRRGERNPAGLLVAGVILILLGGMFLAERLGIAEFGEVVGNWWPLIPVLVGIPKLFSRETVWSGLWMIAVGAWLLISHQGLFGFGWASSWPLLLIAIGGGMVLRAIVDAVWPEEGKGKEDERHHAA